MHSCEIYDSATLLLQIIFLFHKHPTFIHKPSSIYIHTYIHSHIHICKQNFHSYILILTPFILHSMEWLPEGPNQNISTCIKNCSIKHPTVLKFVISKVYLGIKHYHSLCHSIKATKVQTSKALCRKTAAPSTR